MAQCCCGTWEGRKGEDWGPWRMCAPQVHSEEGLWMGGGGSRVEWWERLALVIVDRAGGWALTLSTSCPACGQDTPSLCFTSWLCFWPCCHPTQVLGH